MLKFSKQRTEIEKAVKANPIHPTAEQVYQIVRKTSPQISLGTVYRNLNLLADHGILLRLRMPDGGDRYDGTLHEHAHVMCTCCGAVADLDVTVPNLAQTVLTQSGITMQSYNLTVSGLCAKCLSKQVQNEDSVSSTLNN
ncbi:MAG: transcriptional repressor [Oscillospiraceae bacterium]|nr:transcriptional repressor [Oscillospiraceae bacterium]